MYTAPADEAERLRAMLKRKFNPEEALGEAIDDERSEQ